MTELAALQREVRRAKSNLDFAKRELNDLLKKLAAHKKAVKIDKSNKKGGKK